jgi:hypothetical protein
MQGILAGRLLLLFLFVISIHQELKAQRPTLYPAKKDNHWGFIDSTGKWIIEPVFNRNLNWPDRSSVYFMLDSIDLHHIKKNNLIVFNKYGDTIRFLKDWMYDSVQQIGRYSSLDYFMMEMKYGLGYRDSVLEKRKQENDKRILMENYEMLYSIRRDTFVHDKGCQFSYKGKRNLGGYEPISNHYLLVNKGGWFKFRVYNYNIGLRERYMNAQIVGGQWGIMAMDGTELTDFNANSKSDIRYLIKPFTDNWFDRKIQLVSILSQSTNNQRHLKVWNEDFKVVYESEVLDKQISLSNSYQFNLGRRLAKIYIILPDSSRCVLVLDSNGNSIDTLQASANMGKFVATKKQDVWILKANNDIKNHILKIYPNVTLKSKSSFSTTFYLFPDSIKYGLILDSAGNVLDSFTAIKFNDEFYALKKHGLWSVYDYVKKDKITAFKCDHNFSLEPPYFYSYSKNDSVVVGNIKENKTFKFKGKFLQAVTPELYITRSYHKNLYRFYDKNGVLKLTDSGDCLIRLIHKEDVIYAKSKNPKKKYWFEKKGLYERDLKIHELYKYNSSSYYVTIRKKQREYIIDSNWVKRELIPLNNFAKNELSVGGYYKDSKYLIYNDSVLAISKYCNFLKIYGGSSGFYNDSLIMIGKFYSSKNRLKWYVSKHLQKRVTVYYISLRNSNKMIRLKTSAYFREPERLNNILYITTYNKDEWFYMNQKGEIIYKSPYCPKVKAKNTSVKKFIKRW